MKRLLTLTDDERAAISCRYKHEKNPRFRERLHCLLLKDRGHTNGEVADMLLVSQDTITVWLNLYEDGGVETLCRLETGGSDGFLTPEQIATLCAELDKPVFQTAKQVCAWVQEHFAVTYSERGMRDLLRRLGYSRQKAHLVPAQADVEAQAAFLKGVCGSQDDPHRNGESSVWRCGSLPAQRPSRLFVGQEGAASRLDCQLRTQALQRVGRLRGFGRVRRRRYRRDGERADGNRLD